MHVVGSAKLRSPNILFPSPSALTLGQKVPLHPASPPFVTAAPTTDWRTMPRHAPRLGLLGSLAPQPGLVCLTRAATESAWGIISSQRLHPPPSSCWNHFPVAAVVLASTTVRRPHCAALDIPYNHTANCESQRPLFSTITISLPRPASISLPLSFSFSKYSTVLISHFLSVLLLLSFSLSPGPGGRRENSSHLHPLSSF